LPAGDACLLCFVETKREQHWLLARKHCIAIAARREEARQLPLRPPTDIPPPPASLSWTPATSMYLVVVGLGPWKRNFMGFISMSSLFLKRKMRQNMKLHAEF